MNIFFTLVVFDGGLLKPFTMLCKGFRKHILFEFKNQFAPAVEKFKETYKDYFQFDSMHLWRSSIAYGTQQGTRVDQVIKFKVKSICKQQVVNFGCVADRYESTIKKRPNQNTYFKFDCFNPGAPRWQWVHKEEREFHGPSDVRSYTIPVSQVCAEDYVEVSVTIMSLMGVMDMSSIEWRPIVFEPLPDQEDIRNYNRVKNMTPDRNKFQKYFADLKRVCEVEDTVIEWFDKQHHVQICQESLKDHIRR